MLRIAKIMLVFSVAAWGLVGAFGNFADWEGTTGAIGAATSMATFEGGAESWRATSTPAVVMAGAVFIIASKMLAGILCLVGAARMAAALGADAAAFQEAKSLALTGCAVAVFMLFFGFIVIAESWFELWRSEVMREPVLGSAYRYAGMIGLIAVFVGMREK